MPQALICGISPFDFWKLTFKEIKDCIKQFAERQEAENKNQIMRNYETANLISYFMALRLDGKQIPTFEELYPSLVDDRMKEQRAEQETMAYKSEWIAFAERHNKLRKLKEAGK